MALGLVAPVAISVWVTRTPAQEVSSRAEAEGEQAVFHKVVPLRMQKSCPPRGNCWEGRYFRAEFRLLSPLVGTPVLRTVADLNENYLPCGCRDAYEAHDAAAGGTQAG